MTETWTHTMNWYCINIGCPKCPFRQGNLCTYEKELKE